MAFNTRPFTTAGNRTTANVTRTVNRVAPKKKAPPKYAPNDAFPASLLVPTLSDAQLQGQAHAAAGADVAAHLAAIPTDASVQGQYGQLGSNIAGINQALVDALGGTQRFQIGTANGIAQGYTAAAGADQSAAQQAAAALGGSAGQLSGTGGQAAAALSAPGVSAANATGGLIDAAKLRGANQQITNQQDLASALAALGASRTAEQAKEGSYYQGYLSDAQKANQSALQANQDAAFKYANLGIAQQNANSRAAYDSALAALSGQRVGLQATGLADTSSYRAGMLAQGADRTAIAARNADTAAYRAQHPTSGNPRNPSTGFTQGETTRALGSLQTSLTKNAAAGLKGKKTSSKAADRYTLTYETVPSPGQAPGIGHVTLTPEQYRQYMAGGRSDRARIAGLPEGTYVPGSFQTPQPSHYDTTTTTSGRSYYDTEHSLEAQIAKAAALYHLNWNHAQIVREAQAAMTRGGWKPGMYGAPGAAPQGRNPGRN
jgi:hypothetical protein